MIQFNLLPDVKLEFIKARRLKRLVVMGSVGFSTLALFILILVLVSVDVVQKKSLHDLNKDIQSNTTQLKSIPDLDKILTVQNQLNTVNSLHDKKAASSRLFQYLPEFTPPGITMSNLTLDFTQNNLTLTGSAPSLEDISAFIGTLKAATYTSDSTTVATKAFSNVVLSSFSRGDQGGSSSYSTTFNFDPAIFDITKPAVTISIPKTTISNTSVLFQENKE